MRHESERFLLAGVVVGSVKRTLEEGGEGRWQMPILLLMALGLFVQLAGLLFNTDGSRYATQLYLLFFVPALGLLICQRFALALWCQASGIILLVLFGWVLLMAGVQQGASETIGYWAKVVCLVMLYVFAVATLVRRERIFVGVVLAAALAVAVFAWLTLYYQYSVLERPLSYPEVRGFRLFELGWRGFANLDHPIVAGLYYGVFTVLYFWLFVRFTLRLWQSAALIIGVAGILLYVLFTFSRGAWFSVAASIFLLLVISPNLKSRVLLGLACVSLVANLWFFWPEILAERSVGLSNRDQIWQNWLLHLPGFWLWGSGAGADLYYRFANGYEVIHSHSLYLQLWYEYGVVGITLFASLLLSLLWKGWQCREQPLARLGIALLVFAMVAMVSDVYAVFHRPSPYWVVFWFPVGILLGVKRAPAR